VARVPLLLSNHSTTKESLGYLIQLKELRQKAGIKMPEVADFSRSRMHNAFATGWKQKAALVAVSSAC